MENSIETVFLHGDESDDTIIKLIFHCASEGIVVWCITPNPINVLPTDVKIPHFEALKLITFSYIKDYKQLIKYVNNAHSRTNCPSMILLTNIDKYLDLVNNSKEVQQRNCFIIASILDALASCSNKTKTKSLLMLMTGNSNGDNIMLQHIVQLYMDHIICVKNGENNFLINLNEIIQFCL